MLNLWCSLLCPAGCQSPFPQLHNPLVAGKAIACSVAQQQVCECVWGGGGGGGEGGRGGRKEGRERVNKDSEEL